MATEMILGRYPVSRMTSAQDGCAFYCALGPFFASRAVRKEFDEYPLNDSPDHVWFVATDADRVIAFASVLCHPDRGIAQLGDTYVAESYRRQGIASALLGCREREAAIHGIHRLKGIANARSRGYFEQAGYTLSSQRGRFFYFTKEVGY